MEETNISFMFYQLIYDYAHLVTEEPQTKEEFLQSIKNTCTVEDTKTTLFYQATNQSFFYTIRFHVEKNEILFNQ